MSWPPWSDERAALAPAGHAAVDEARVAGEADVGSDAEAFGDAGPVPLDQDVGALDELQHELLALAAGGGRWSPTRGRGRSRGAGRWCRTRARPDRPG